MEYGDLQLKTIGVLQDAAGDLPSEEVDRLIAEAVRRYSGLRPRVVVADVPGADSHDYPVALLSEWAEGHSVIQQVEYPILATTIDPPILERDVWMEYVTPSGRVLRMLQDKPTPTDTLRVMYTALHVADADTFTIPENDFDAVANWAARLCCRALANKYAQNTEPSLGVDRIENLTKSREYASRAKDLWKDVSSHLKVSDTETAAGSAIVDWDSDYAFGQPWLTHARRRR